MGEGYGIEEKGGGALVGLEHTMAILRFGS